MKSTEIMKVIGRSFNKVSFNLKKHSPEILVAVGVVGTVTSAVMACKATTKLSGILEEAKDTVEKVHDTLADENITADRYSEEDSKKELAIIYTQTGLKIVKLYAPSVAFGALSLGCILTSNNILRKRNVALAAAYTTVYKSFKEYRNRVVERFGKEIDRELKYNIKAKEIKETVVDEKGKEKKVKKTIQVVDPNVNSEYSAFFEAGNPYWEKNGEYNLMFLRAQQQFANDKLRAKGYLFLNEVYEMLGIRQTQAGQIVGWVYDPKNEDHIGDDYVDFGIRDIYKPLSSVFDNASECEYERTYLLEFNVDGNIMNTCDWSANGLLC